MKSDVPYLVYIRDAIQDIEHLTPPDRETLDDETFRHSLAAILYYLHTMAEASQRISDALKSTYSEIDWRGIAGFRNRLVHGYLSINTAVIWNVVQNDLPSLRDVIERMLRDVEESQDE